MHSSLLHPGMIIASIDIGTNTILLLVARVDGDRIHPLRAEERIPRLGEGVDGAHRLRSGAMERAGAVLEEYRAIIRPFAPAAVVVCGTSALRDAANRDEFIQLVAQRTGFRVEILSGEDEAVWTYRGAIGEVRETDRAAVLDIGGGSTELTLGRGGQIDLRHSAQIGAVRLTERYFRSDPPAMAELTAAAEEADRSLRPIDPTTCAGARLVGVAGTVVTLASIAGQAPETRSGSPFPSHLMMETVERLYRRLSRLPSSAIRPLSPLMEGRADLITAGALILRQVMRRFEFGEVLVSEKGLRYGLVAREWERRR